MAARLPTPPLPPAVCLQTQVWRKTQYLLCFGLPCCLCQGSTWWPYQGSAPCDILAVTFCSWHGAGPAGSSALAWGGAWAHAGLVIRIFVGAWPFLQVRQENSVHFSAEKTPNQPLQGRMLLKHQNSVFTELVAASQTNMMKMHLASSTWGFSWVQFLGPFIYTLSFLAWVAFTLVSLLSSHLSALQSPESGNHTKSKEKPSLCGSPRCHCGPTPW